MHALTNMQVHDYKALEATERVIFEAAFAAYPPSAQHPPFCSLPTTPSLADHPHPFPHLPVRHISLTSILYE